MAEKKPEQTTEKKAEPVVITFTKPYSRYSRGDVAGFSAADAERMVAGRVAVKGSKLPAKSADQDTEPKA